MWLLYIPGIEALGNYYWDAFIAVVTWVNNNFFHIHSTEKHGPVGGSGDTSVMWAAAAFFLVLSFIGAIIWSVADRKRQNYRVLNYWLCLVVRYNVAMIAFLYGIIKLFAQQMVPASLSQMATPFGDFLPMRLSWLFIGYSEPYQIFTGVMEFLVGLLLIYRRTVTLGVILGTAVFANVMVMNLAYDIPVKLYSIHIFLMCVFLLCNEYNRLMCFFILNKPALACDLYQFSYSKKWMRIGRIVLKILFLVMAVGMIFYEQISWRKERMAAPPPKPLERGVYDIVSFVLNADTIPALKFDTVRWGNLIIDTHRSGSVETTDTSFNQRYRRGYFIYFTDTVAKTLKMKRFGTDTAFFANFNYSIPAPYTMELRGRFRADSLYVLLRKANRNFQLTGNNFHWISEANR